MPAPLMGGHQLESDFGLSFQVKQGSQYLCYFLQLTATSHGSLLGVALGVNCSEAEVHNVTHPHMCTCKRTKQVDSPT